MKAVPAFQLDFRAQMTGDGDDGQSGNLGEGQDALLDDIRRSFRAVGGYREVKAVFSHRDQFKQSLGSAPAGGAADGSHAEASEDGGEEGAVPAGADETGESLGPVMAASEDGMEFHGEGQAIVPGAIDDLADVLACHKSVGIVDTAADGGGYGMDNGPDGAGAEGLMPLRAVRHNAPALPGGSYAGAKGILELGHSDYLFTVRMPAGMGNAKGIVGKNAGRMRNEE